MLVFRIVEAINYSLICLKSCLERAVKFSTRDELLQRFHRSARSEPREIIVESDFRFVFRHLNVSGEVVEIRNIDADHCGAGFRHLLHCGLGDGIYFLMHRIAAKEVHKHANASALQTVSIQECSVCLWDPRSAKSADWVLRIVTRHDVQHAHGVFYRASDGPSLILGRAYRNNSTSANQPSRWTQPNEALCGSRRPNRLPGVAAGAGDAKACRHRCDPAAAGAARRSCEVIGITRLAAQRTHGRSASREFR